jgi:hypothetical protein
MEKQRDGSERLIDVSFDIPQIRIHCPADICNGQRFFRVNTDDLKYITAPVNKWCFKYITYNCANCQQSVKIFGIALSTRLSDKPPHGARVSYALLCYKIGEAPPFGPTTPARLISLIGPDRDLFLKGRTCENQGLGIGAFGYYRRVVENQKNRVLAEIIKVAQLLSMPPDTIAVLHAAQNEQQFRKAIDGIKDAIPHRLLIDGQNPLTLLHAALSKGLHNRSDEVCLELATDIRLILAKLADLLGQALSDERELKEAVARLRRMS